ncbi:hypothetical protein [Methylophaga nitratireducenticrescens]|uniref:hypothetical protein n=1 Tax=Methylophaga nitratireducenticrescens TaxID=754476 RepID=UPI000CDC79FD|nr:hypothetical protein [Methylophaga nitratireducenticrescens]AUZ85815.1 hypothetical protein CDW43_15130 [Methylophaga nitratireducenticrescens]AUZ85883.1 hypothetical protein CDW43_15485 [Methylophaga nitratireducenticrescens]
MTQITRPAPVDSMFLHMFNDSFIFISSSTLEAEMQIFENALALDSIASVKPDDEVVFESLAELIQQQLASCVLPPSIEQLRVLLSFLPLQDRQFLMHRLQQLSLAMKSKKRFHLGDTFLMSPTFHHRWFELIAGRVLHADVICLDMDDF